ncbi:MAG: SEL1-like repeat protein [Deltaproteobacteria bacterium]|nr:SEL1-like repeat protein [Deltaproteobacteria bacterium]
MEKAVYWFQKAADQGLTKAQINLGVMYLSGKGVTKDRTQALRWIQKVVASASPPSESTIGYVLSPKESNLISYMINEEVSGLARGADTLYEEMIEDTIRFVTSVDVAKEYEKNQVAADQKYFKKRLIVSGKIKSINSGLDNSPYVLLQGNHSLMDPQAHFDDSQTQKVALLKKGEDLVLACEGNGAVIGVPMFANCIFKDKFIQQLKKEVSLKIGDFFNGRLVEDYYQMSALCGLLFARWLPDNSPCLMSLGDSNQKVCEGEVHKMLEQRKVLVSEGEFVSDVISLLAILSSKGVKVQTEKLVDRLLAKESSEEKDNQKGSDAVK